jgi:hypothetical protein
MSAYKINPIRLISAVVMTCFVMQEVALAAPMSVAAAPPMPLPPPMAISQFINDPARIDMPLEHVTVQEIHPGTNGKLIIHIQDAHANLSGQQSLAKALDKLLTQYDLRLVLVEGSARDSSLDEIRKLAPLKEWSIIARRFLYEGIISGEEYLNLTTEHPMKIIGVEYRDLYDEAVKAYAAIVDRRKDILHYLYQAKVSLDRLKVRMYPRELKDYEARKGPNDGTSTLDFKTGFSDLMKLAAQAEYPLTEMPQVKKLKELMEKESLVDFDKAGKEQEAILKGLSVAGADEEVRAFSEASRRLRYSQVSQYLLIQKLLQTASKREVAIENFPELMAYAGYLEKFTDLKMEALMTELEYLEDKVYEKLLPDDDARKVRAIDRFLGLLGNAYKLQMSSHDFGMFTFNEKDFKTEGWLAFMNRQLVDLGFFESLVPYQSYLEDARADFGRFYQLVGERDNAFVENAERIMSEQHENAAVLIAGGYHTAHLTQLLREEGTSYIVLTPVVTDSTDHKRYEELLLSHLRDQEKRLAVSNSASKKDTAPYRAQNVAQTKIPRGLRLISYGSRLAAGEMPGLNIIASRLPNMVEPFREAAARFTDRLQLNSAARMAAGDVDTVALPEDPHDNSIVRVTDAEIEALTAEVKKRLPEKYWQVLDETIGNFPKFAHQEGFALKHHLAAMLRVLDNPRTFFSIIHEQFRDKNGIESDALDLLEDADWREFFIEFILGHDIGKLQQHLNQIYFDKGTGEAYVPSDFKGEKGITAITDPDNGETIDQTYRDHEALSVGLVIEDPAIAKSITGTRRGMLIEAIRHHGAIYGLYSTETRQVSDEKFTEFIQSIDLERIGGKENIDLFIKLAIAAGYLDTNGFYFHDGTKFQDRIRAFSAAYGRWRAAQASSDPSGSRMAEFKAPGSPDVSNGPWEILPPDKGGFPDNEIEQGARQIADFLRQHVGGRVSGQTIPVESAPTDLGVDSGTFVMADLSAVPVAPSRIVSPREQDELLAGLRNASQKILSSWASEGRAPGIVHIPVARGKGENDDDFRNRLLKMANNLQPFTNPRSPIAYPIFVMKDRSSGNLVPVDDNRFDIDLDASIVKAMVKAAGLSDYRTQAQDLIEKNGAVPITLISEQFESLWLEVAAKSIGGLVRIDGDDLIAEPHHVLLAATLSMKDGASLSLPLWNSLMAEKDPNSPITEEVASEFRSGTTDSGKLKRFALNALSSISGVVDRASRSLLQALQSA